MKKKCIAFLIAALFALTVTACDLPDAVTSLFEEDPAFLTVSVETETDYGKNAPHMSLERKIFRLTDTSLENHPALDASLEKMNEEIRAYTDDIFVSYAEAADEYPHPTSNPSPEVTHSAYIMRADSLAFSVLADTYSYTGGVHGLNYTEGFTYDSETGQRLSLTDIVADQKAFSALVEADLRKELSTYFEHYAPDIHSFLWENGDYLQWTMDYRGINVYFNPYEIASYAAGIPMVHVPFAAHPDIFNEKYSGTAPGSYMISIPQGIAFCYGIDESHTPQYLHCGDRYADNDMYFFYFLETENGNYTEETYAYEHESIFIKTRDGKQYIYAQSVSDNDFRTLHVFDITDGTCKKVDEMYAGIYHSDYPVNPESFSLQHRMDLLSSGHLHRLYAVGEDGMPLSLETVSIMNRPVALTVKSEVETEVVDKASGNVTGTRILRKGEYAEYFGADDMSHAYLMLSDGTVCRVKVNHSDYPYRINGTNIENLFEGMLFAG